MDLTKEELAQNVYISVMAIDHRLQAIQTFTNDRGLLRTAINRATASVNDYTKDSMQVRAQLEQMLGPMQGGDSSVTGRANALSSAASSASGPGAANNSDGAVVKEFENLEPNAQGLIVLEFIHVHNYAEVNSIEVWQME